MRSILSPTRNLFRLIDHIRLSRIFSVIYFRPLFVFINLSRIIPIYFNLAVRVGASHRSAITCVLGVLL